MCAVDTVKSIVSTEHGIRDTRLTQNETIEECDKKSWAEYRHDEFWVNLEG